MIRRNFLKSALAGSAAVAGAAGNSAIPRRRYRDDVQLSVIGFGGIVVVSNSQSAADKLVSEAIDRGVNYFDVAPSYWDGEAEMKLGNSLKPYRKDVFLACKTTQRDAAGARKELEQSLGRLHTDHFDLYQFHAVTKMEEVEQILAPGGAAETFLKARDEGKVKYLGASAHSTEAAIALMDRFKLDSILFPINFVCWSAANFGPEVVAKAKEKGVARLALKGLAHKPWGKGEKHTYEKTWYEPIEDPELARQALRFTLSEDITAAIPPGEEKFFRLALDIASKFRPLSKTEREQLMARAKTDEPIFPHSA
jgi:predicted aldo/keto reductase-like oxidoreductase